jgi:hypothetical protein
MGRIVTQDGKLLGYFSRKITKTQQCYPVNEQELLAIVETLKYFHRVIGASNNSQHRSQKFDSPFFNPYLR